MRVGPFAAIATGLAALAGCGPRAAGVGTGSFADGTCVIPEIEARDGSLRIEHETRLGGEGAGPGLLTDVSGMTNAVRDGRGRDWIGQGGAVAVFGADGAYVGAVGRQGQGPLEFFRAYPFHVDALNRVHVLDPANLRVTLVHDDLSTATEVSLPVPAVKMEALDDGRRYAFAGWMPTGDHAGQPVHVVEDGQVAASFGTVPGDVSAPPLDAMAAQWKILATDEYGVVFVGADREYFVEAWAEDGRRIGRIQGPAMDNGPRRAGRWSDDNPPPHRVRDIRVGRDGLLWRSWNTGGPIGEKASSSALARTARLLSPCPATTTKRYIATASTSSTWRLATRSRRSGWPTPTSSDTS